MPGILATVLTNKTKSRIQTIWIPTNSYPTRFVTLVSVVVRATAQHFRVQILTPQFIPKIYPIFVIMNLTMTKNEIQFEQLKIEEKRLPLNINIP